MHKPNAEIETMIKIHSAMWLRHEAMARNKPNETYELENDSSCERIQQPTCHRHMLIMHVGNRGQEKKHVDQLSNESSMFTARTLYPWHNI